MSYLCPAACKPHLSLTNNFTFFLGRVLGRLPKHISLHCSCLLLSPQGHMGWLEMRTYHRADNHIWDFPGNMESVLLARAVHAGTRPGSQSGSQYCSTQQRRVSDSILQWPPPQTRAVACKWCSKWCTKCILGWKCNFPRQISHTRTHINCRFWALIHQNRCRSHKLTDASRVLGLQARIPVHSWARDTKPSGS